MDDAEMQRRVDEAESRAAEMERRYDETAVAMRDMQEAKDTEISELRTEITRLERVIYE